MEIETNESNEVVELLRIKNHNLSGIEFEIGGKSVLIEDIDTLIRIAESINDYCDFNIRISNMIYDYEAHKESPEDFLAGCVVNKDGRFYYDVGEDFGYALEVVDEDGMVDYETAAKKVEHMFEELNPGDVFFEADDERVSVFTINKESALVFLDFSMKTIIKPFISNFYENNA